MRQIEHNKGFTQLQFKYKTVAGFTLLEMLVVLGIFIIILGALISSISFFYRSNTHTLEQSFAINSARKGVEGMVKDMREATYSDEGAYPVIEMGTSTLSFYADVDSDIFIEKVRYSLEGTNLIRGITDSSGDPRTYNSLNEATSTISDNVRNSDESTDLFTLYDASGSEITNMANTTGLRFVSVKIVVDVNQNAAPESFTLQSSATLRNVRE